MAIPHIRGQKVLSELDITLDARILGKRCNISNVCASEPGLLFSDSTAADLKLHTAVGLVSLGSIPHIDPIKTKHFGRVNSHFRDLTELVFVYTIGINYGTSANTYYYFWNGEHLLFSKTNTTVPVGIERGQQCFIEGTVHAREVRQNYKITYIRDLKILL